MKIQYDKLADALYIYLKKGKIKKTVKLKDRLIVDCDKDGKILGLEILEVSSQVSKKEISRIQIENPLLVSMK